MRLEAVDVDSSAVVVSIHASVKDATMRQNKAQVENMVSIHASVKDATPR